MGLIMHGPVLHGCNTTSDMKNRCLDRREAVYYYTSVQPKHEENSWPSAKLKSRWPRRRPLNTSLRFSLRAWVWASEWAARWWESSTCGALLQSQLVAHGYFELLACNRRAQLVLGLASARLAWGMGSISLAWLAFRGFSEGVWWCPLPTCAHHIGRTRETTRLSDSHRLGHQCDQSGYTVQGYGAYRAHHGLLSFGLLSCAPAGRGLVGRPRQAG